MKSILKPLFYLSSLLLTAFFSCKKNKISSTDWNRYEEAVLRDHIPEDNFEIASDGHIFFDENGTLRMIYSGETDGKSAIKYATGTSWTNWKIEGNLLDEAGPSGKDVFKETAFYYLTEDGKHQIYYIGYPDEENYEAEIYRAEAESFEGPYLISEQPIVKKGIIADKNVYTMTSPSVVEHDDVLYLSFIGWNNSPEEVTEVWIMGCTSTDQGQTWSEIKEVECPIGMEGQITKGPDGKFYAVSTGEFSKKKEAIYYSESNHPFGPWTINKTPIITQTGKDLEKDEVIAPQITFDPATGKKQLYYTGANHKKGWWMILATEP